MKSLMLCSTRSQVQPLQDVLAMMSNRSFSTDENGFIPPELRPHFELLSDRSLAIADSSQEQEQARYLNGRMAPLFLRSGPHGRSLSLAAFILGWFAVVVFFQAFQHRIAICSACRRASVSLTRRKNGRCPFTS